jgi:hypothetical protein
MTVAESHDIALELQHKIEGLADVERAFVHVDYLARRVWDGRVWDVWDAVHTDFCSAALFRLLCRRDAPEHKVERELAGLAATPPPATPALQQRSVHRQRGGHEGDMI